MNVEELKSSFKQALEMGLLRDDLKDKSVDELVRQYLKKQTESEKRLARMNSEMKTLFKKARGELI